MKTKAIFPGSFDPFTIGHGDIVERALALFDEVVIAIGVNERKMCLFSPEARLKTIRDFYAGRGRVTVKTYAGLTTDFALREGAGCIVKGIRSVKDFEYERDQADINRTLTGIDTLFLFAKPELAAVSSSVVRELAHFGKDVSGFLPQRNEEMTKE